MRICLVSTSYRPRTGGLETHVTTLAEALVNKGHEVTVLTNRDNTRQPRITQERGVRVLRASALLADLFAPDKVPWEEALFGLLRDFAEFLADDHFDVVHTHTQAALLLASLSGLAQSAPVVASFHETQPDADPCGLSRSRFVVGGTNPELILAGSLQFARQAIAFGAPPARVRVVYHGLPEPQRRPARPQARELLFEHVGVGADGVLVTLVGRFKPRKGQLRLLAAYKQMATRPRTRLLFVGSCNSADIVYLKEIRQYIANFNLTEQVTVLEDCSDDLRDLAWAATDVATQPSSLEGLGLACVEAMQAGVPVVASDVVGLREVVTPEAGLLVDTNDPVAYAKALDVLIASPSLRCGLGASAACRAREVFGVDRALEETLTVYGEAIAARTN